MQIRSKLTLQFILIVATIMLLAFYYIYNQFRAQIQNEFYESLRSKAFLTGEMLVGKTKDKNDTFSFSRPSNEFNPISTENISIYNNENRLVYTFSNTNSKLDVKKLNEVRIEKERRFVNDKYNSIGVLYKNKYGYEYVIVAESVFNYTQLNYLITILIWVYLLGILLVAMAGWFFSGNALRPVSIIMNEVEEILPSDMTHRLNQSEQKDELSRLVQTFNKLLDRIQHVFENQKLFLSNISHELKNPLNVILSQIDVALNKERPAIEYRNTLQSVYEDVLELNEVSSKIMQLSKINADGSSVKFDFFRIDEMVFLAKSSLLKMDSEKHRNIQIVLNQLPEDEKLLYFWGNEQLIRTALVNIIENAFKYSDNKEVQVSIHFYKNEKTVVEVKDKGVGIDTKDMKLIFEPFFRSQNSGPVKGSGIGLSLVKSIFDLHQIKLEVYSEIGKGSIFSIIFPLAKTSKRT